MVKTASLNLSSGLVWSELPPQSRPSLTRTTDLDTKISTRNLQWVLPPQPCFRCHHDSVTKSPWPCLQRLCDRVPAILSPLSLRPCFCSLPDPVSMTVHLTIWTSTSHSLLRSPVEEGLRIDQSEREPHTRSPVKFRNIEPHIVSDCSSYPKGANIHSPQHMEYRRTSH
jgi:hypothetical protein